MATTNPALSHFIATRAVPMGRGKVRRAEKAEPAVVELMGQPVHVLTQAQVVGHIIGSIERGEGGWVATHNLDHLRRLKRDPDFARLCATASLRTADGRPLVWASKLQGTPLPERVTGSDLVCSLSEAAGRRGLRVYLIGGNVGTAERAAAVLEARYPGLQVVGTDCPEPGYEKSSQRRREIVSRMAEARPDIVYVALGSPKQEWLIPELLAAHPTGWYLGVGISLSFLTGEVRRAPQWMQQGGLEWVHRLAQEPRRLAKRYLVDGLPFFARLMGEAAVGRMGFRTVTASPKPRMIRGQMA